MKKLKSAALLCGFLLPVLLVGCTDSEEVMAPSKEYVYRYEELAVSEAMPDAYNLFMAGENIYTYGIRWNNDYSQSWLDIGRLDEKGVLTDQISLEQAPGVSVNWLTGNEDGALFGCRMEYGETTNDTGEIVYSENYYLFCLDRNGVEAWSVCLNDIGELNDTEYFYAGAGLCLPDRRLLISIGEKYGLFDTEGNFLQTLELIDPEAEEEEGGSTPGNILLLKDGRLIESRYDDAGLVFQVVNYDTGVYEEKYLLEGNAYSYSLYPGVGYDLLLTDNSNVYGYDLGGEPVRLMNYVDSDLNVNGISSLVAFSETLFWGSIYDITVNQSVFASFTKIAPEDIPDREAITMAGSYIDQQVKGEVVRFNRSNEHYRIYLTDYSVLYNTPEDYNAGVNRLNADIAAGKIPDILTMSSDLPVKSYMAKGLFADLMPLIEQDEELDASDLMPNVVSAYSYDGHLYQLVPRFSVQTVFAKTVDVGPDPGWTIQEAVDLVASKPEGTVLFGEVTREDILRSSVDLGGDQYINWEKGECYYNSESFIDLLEFAKTFPEELDSPIYDDPSLWRSWESGWREGRVLAQMSSIDSFRWYNQNMQSTFGEEITMIGFPVEQGSGSVLFGIQSFSLSARSRVQEGAWEFLRYYLTDEYQMNQDYYGLPLSIRAFDQMGEDSMKKRTYVDELGNEVETDDYYYINDQEFIVEPITTAELEKVKNYIYQVDEAYERNQDLLNIITEEAASFFAGQKTVGEVADIIQSRAQIFVSENL